MAYMKGRKHTCAISCITLAVLGFVLLLTLLFPASAGPRARSWWYNNVPDDSSMPRMLCSKSKACGDCPDVELVTQCSDCKMAPRPFKPDNVLPWELTDLGRRYLVFGYDLSDTHSRSVATQAALTIGKMLNRIVVLLSPLDDDEGREMTSLVSWQADGVQTISQVLFMTQIAPGLDTDCHVSMENALTGTTLGRYFSWHALRQSIAAKTVSRFAFPESADAWRTLASDPSRVLVFGSLTRTGADSAPEVLVPASSQVIDHFIQERINAMVRQHVKHRFASVHVHVPSRCSRSMKAGTRGCGPNVAKLSAKLKELEVDTVHYAWDGATTSVTGRLNTAVALPAVFLDHQAAWYHTLVDQGMMEASNVFIGSVQSSLSMWVVRRRVERGLGDATFVYGQDGSLTPAADLQTPHGGQSRALQHYSPCKPVPGDANAPTTPNVCWVSLA